MSQSSPPSAESEFPSWYGKLAIVQDDDVRAKRWKGVDALAREAAGKAIEALVRVAFKTRKPPAEAQLAQIRQAFRKTDETFPLQDNDVELRVLAGACLARAMECPGWGEVAALAVTTAACHFGRAAQDLPFDLVGRAEAALATMSKTLESRPDLMKQAPAAPPVLDFKRVFGALEGSNLSLAQVPVALQEIEKTVRDALHTMASRQSALAAEVGKHLESKDEELQILWWLVGRHSEDLDLAFDDVKPREMLGLVLANELARLTTTAPGPGGIRSVLSQAGLGGAHHLPIEYAANAAGTEWLSRHIEDRVYSPVTMPIHFALERRRDAGGTDWISNWSVATGLAATHGMAPLDLGILFYRERLLANDL